jgi:DNA-binding ferritin-like protein
MRTRHSKNYDKNHNYNKNHNKTKKNGGRKSISTSTLHSMEKFQKEMTLIFFEILLMIKLYHWKTHSYATHRATDELYSSLNKNMDKFIEVILGKTGTRIDLHNVHSLKLDVFNSQEELKRKVEQFKGYLVGLDTLI